MGDPKKQRKKYSTPSHPWNKERIDFEKEIVREYGLRRKNEVWKAQSVLKRLQFLAKKMIGSDTKQSNKERELLLNRVYKLGYLPKDSKVEELLNLQLKDILDRRLQTIVFRKKLTNSMLQSRQFIIHEHISVNGIKVTSPAYVVPVDHETSVGYAPNTNIKEVMAQELQQKSEKEVGAVKEVAEGETEVKEEKPVEVKEEKAAKVEKKEVKEEKVVKEEPVKVEVKNESKK